MALRGPPGGEPARAREEVVLPVDGVEASGPDSGPEFRGDEGRGEDCECVVSSIRQKLCAGESPRSCIAVEGRKGCGLVQGGTYHGGGSGEERNTTGEGAH